MVSSAHLFNSPWGSILSADPLPIGRQPNVKGFDRVPRDSKFCDGDVLHPRPNIGDTGCALVAWDAAQQLPLVGSLPAE